MARNPRRTTGKHPQRNTHELRDVAFVLKPDLERLARTIRPSFITQVAGVGKTVVSGILRGSQTRCTAVTYSLLLEAVCKIEAGEVPIPDRARRIPRKPTARMSGATHCVRDHAFTEDNTYVTPSGTRTCRECQRMARLAWRERNPEKHAQMQNAAARRRYNQKKEQAA